MKVGRSERSGRAAATTHYVLLHNLSTILPCVCVRVCLSVCVVMNNDDISQFSTMA